MKVFTLFSCSLLLASSTAFANITLTADPGYGTSPAMFTLDPQNYSEANRNVTGTRALRQTFQLSEGLSVDQIVLSLSVQAAGVNGGLVLNFYQVADVNASYWTAGTLVHTITVDPSVALPVSTQQLGLDLSGSDVFTLAQRNSGTEGYGIEISNADGTTTIGALNISNDGTDEYPNGVFYTETGTAGTTGSTPNLTRDAGVSLSGVAVVPEPSVLAFLGLGLFGFVARLRRKR